MDNNFSQFTSMDLLMELLLHNFNGILFWKEQKESDTICIRIKTKLHQISGRDVDNLTSVYSTCDICLTLANGLLLQMWWHGISRSLEGLFVICPSISCAGVAPRLCMAHWFEGWWTLTNKIHTFVCIKEQ